MAARLVRTLNGGSGSVFCVKAQLQKGHLLGSIPTFSRRFCAQSVYNFTANSGDLLLLLKPNAPIAVLNTKEASSHSKIRYVVSIKLPPGREEELLSNAEEKEKWYHSFISGGKRTRVGSDKDPRIQQTRVYGRSLGFSALLTREEALALKEYYGFVCAKPEKSIPSPYPRRPKNEIKKTPLYKDLDLHIYASEEIKEKMMAGPIQRQEHMMGMEKEKLHST